MARQTRVINTDVLETLRTHRKEIAELDVAELSVFGSHARGEARKDSDVDVLVRFRGSTTLHRYMALKFRLEELLGRRIDLVTEAALRPELRHRILGEAVRVA